MTKGTIGPRNPDNRLVRMLKWAIMAHCFSSAGVSGGRGAGVWGICSFIKISLRIYEKDPRLSAGLF
jgi:hypothetical protein